MIGWRHKPGSKSFPPQAPFGTGIGNRPRCGILAFIEIVSNQSQDQPFQSGVFDVLYQLADGRRFQFDFSQKSPTAFDKPAYIGYLQVRSSIQFTNQRLRSAGNIFEDSKQEKNI